MSQPSRSDGRSSVLLTSLACQGLPRIQRSLRYDANASSSDGSLPHPVHLPNSTFSWDVHHNGNSGWYPSNFRKRFDRSISVDSSRLTVDILHFLDYLTLGEVLKRGLLWNSILKYLVEVPFPLWFIARSSCLLQMGRSVHNRHCWSLRLEPTMATPG